MPNNQTKPNQTQTTPIAPAGGIGRVRMETATTGRWKPPSDEQPAFTERNRERIEFAQQHLPDEHEGFVVIAMQMIDSTGEPVTRNSIMARLEATGRSMKQLKAKGWFK